MTKAATAIFAGHIIVKDPETGYDVELEIMKDPGSKAMFAIDASYTEQVSDTFNNPYEPNCLQAPE